jgi:hypothetical protein
MQRAIAYIVLFFMVAAVACIKPFQSPRSARNLGYLVVDGTIQIGSPSSIKLSRTKNISSDSSNVPELNAKLFIENEGGEVYNFKQDSAGLYTSVGNPVSFDSKYRLRIETEDGGRFASDFVEAKQSPPIDSVSWKENDQVYIYVNTHDPSNQTKYYRWEYEETGQYHTAYESYGDYVNGQIVFLTPEQTKYNCWQHWNSTDIILGSSAALTNDVITNQVLTVVPNDNSKIRVRYSILVKQYALTPEAYEYWQQLKQNSEQTGNIFDPQPSQLVGNIHDLDDPGRPVMGYISATSITEKRMFIRLLELSVRQEENSTAACDERVIDASQAAEFLSNSNQYRIAYFVTGGGIGIARPRCVDCTLQGGITTKPDYW